MEKYTYPSSPQVKNRDILNPGKEYKQQAVKVVSAVGLFITVYILLMLLAVMLAATVSYFGISIIIFKISFITVMLGLGLIGLGVMVLYFLIKFIFTVKKYDRSGLIEIKEKEYPQLFDFIRTLTQETKTPMPKRVYLSADVNASVFYDSSFFSMFFPVRKNLLIGLGLVNSVNMSEFKAVLAHEFGHFSQHSMKIGSYVYNVNKILYNLLYDNDGYSKAINSWASASGYFYIFAKITIKIVVGIQWILQKMYLLINKSDLSLSRQMEYHADAVSAFVCGPNHLITSLNRIDLAAECYNKLLDQYNEWMSENIKATNLYRDHLETVKHTAHINGLALEHGLPKIDADIINTFVKSRVSVSNEWATHPSLRERENHLLSLDIESTPTVADSPWLLFGDSSIIQEKMTQKVFEVVSYTETPKPFTPEMFKQKFYEQIAQNSFAKEYKTFYNDRSIAPFETEATEVLNAELPSSLSKILTDENSLIPSKIEVRNREMQLLNQIGEPDSQVKFFEFNNQRYTKVETTSILHQIEEEQKQLTLQMNSLDKQVFLLAIKDASPEQQTELKKMYQQYFKSDEEYTKIFEEYCKLSETVAPIYHYEFPVDTIIKIVGEIMINEKYLKDKIRLHLPALKSEGFVDEDLEKKYNIYINNDLEYFDGRFYNNESLDLLNLATNSFITLMHKRNFNIKKRMLDMQIKMIAQHENELAR